jgi:hypothetical protein
MSENTGPQHTSRRPRGRSPAYPAIGLDKAVQRVRQIWTNDKQFPVAVSNVADMWGYASLNGPAAQAVSALRKFGLVNEEGSKDDRVIMVSDLAVQILAHPSSDAKAEAIKEAALNPPIHLEMWDLYGPNLPSDANLTWRLVRERSFTETGAREFLREWRDTIAFAGLTEADASGIVHEPVSESRLAVATPEEKIEPIQRFDGLDSEIQQKSVQPQAEQLETGRQYLEQFLERHGSSPVSALGIAEASPAIQSYPIPVARQGKPPVVVSGNFPLSPVEWDQFMAVLTAMKPVLVSEIS